MFRVQCERNLKSRLINLRQGYIKSGILKDEIVPITIPQRKGEP